VADEPEPYQSLYRRFRPRRFSEVRGQDHVTLALTHMVRDGKVAHAYLFSGPRGTGKTSTARILAMALNCLNTQHGEPCGVCESCLRVRAGTSLDVHELDAASNNGVEAMRDLVARSALGTPGRWKVYIIDEVHMLSAAASNALLKTLEEPPAHVVFVLATTDPQKVLQTIRSRAQHFEFHLLPQPVLTSLIEEVSQAAGLAVDADAIEQVARKGKGSARDALSVLDQFVAVGTVDDDTAVIEELAEALCEKDAGRALVAVADGVAAGRDPRQLGVDLLEYLRNGFLASVAPSVAEGDASRVADQARRLGLPGLVRTMEVIGDALAEMRDSLDTRITLEVAIVRVARPEADHSPAALLERIDRLERSIGGHVPAPGSAGPAPGAPQAPVAPPASPAPKAPPAPAAPAEPGSRAALGAWRTQTNAPTPSAEGPPPAAPAAPVSPPPVDQSRSSPPGTTLSPSGSAPTRDELTKAWGDAVLAQLSPKAKSRFSAGRFVAVEDGCAVFGLPNVIHRDRCEEVRPEVEGALASHFGTAFPLRLTVDAGQPPPNVVAGPVTAAAPAFEDEPVDLNDLEDASPAVTSLEDRLKVAFPGAEEVPS
jgi:DNA polymerase-3 subunit gamma/tau